MAAPLPAHLAEGLREAGALADAGHLDEATRLLRHVVKAAPFHFDALLLLGICRARTGAHKDAVRCFETAARADKSSPIPHNNLGTAFHEQRMYDRALLHYAKAIELAPGYAEAHFNRGNVLIDLGRHQEALASLDAALSLRSDHPQAWLNRGVALEGMNAFDEALAAYRQALALEPNYVDAHWNASLVRLLLGDYENGWREYEWRWRKSDFPSPARNFTPPLWLGDTDLDGKTILLHAEQGFGDTLQFCRYAPLVADRGAKVILEVQPALVELLRSLPGVAEVLAQGDPLPPFDCHCPLMSLPLAFDTRLETIPADVPYLAPPPHRIETWGALLGDARGRPRIGIAWSGDARNRKNAQRSVPVDEILRFSRTVDADWIVVQKDVPAADETAVRAERNWRYFGDRIGDFADTAALMTHLDAVVTVETAVAHLAGALGKPMSILIPWTPDWRWLRDGEANPWYPSARLIRQAVRGDWRACLRQAAAALTPQR